MVEVLIFGRELQLHHTRTTNEVISGPLCDLASTSASQLRYNYHTPTPASAEIPPSAAPSNVPCCNGFIWVFVRTAKYFATNLLHWIERSQEIPKFAVMHSIQRSSSAIPSSWQVRQGCSQLASVRRPVGTSTTLRDTFVGVETDCAMRKEGRSGGRATCIEYC